jgi:predicted nucleic acid-binding protein
VTLVDTNVLLDVLTNDPTWLPWSVSNLRIRANSGPLLINEIIYAEMAGHVSTESELDAAVDELQVRLERTPKSALFLAGEIFRRYRRAGGVRTGVLADFFIGAHAQVIKSPILTRDVRRYRTYFPEVKLITPVNLA